MIRNFNIFVIVAAFDRLKLFLVVLAAISVINLCLTDFEL